MELLRSNVKPGEKATGECGVDYREINGERRGEERRERKQYAKWKWYLTGKMSKVSSCCEAEVAERMDSEDRERDNLNDDNF